MSFEVKLYKVAKRKNSMYIPEGEAGRTLNCVVKEGTGVLTPVITIANAAETFNPSVYNMAYIKAFSRWYWIADWKNEDNMWTCQLKVDVLATYRSTIESQTYYVLRTSTGMTTNIKDDFYPAMTYTTFTKTSKQLWKNSTWASGTFVVGIVGKGGLTNFYLMSNTMFTKLMQSMFSNTDWMKVPVSDIPEAVLKAAVNPAQYIVSLFWLPFDLLSEISLIPASIEVGFWEIGLEGQIGNIRVLPDTYAPVSILTEFTLTPHPQSERGYWLNHEPFSRCYVFNHAFGVININRDNVPADGTITSTINVDVRTGDAEMILSYGKTQLGYARTSMACPVPVGEFKDNLIGLASTIASGINSVISGVSGIDSSISAKSIGNAIDNARGKNEVRNSTGSQLIGNGEMILYEEWTHIVDENNTINGRPFCKNVNMKAQGKGYYVVNNGTTALNGAYLAELEEVKTLLESGVFYA